MKVKGLDSSMVLGMKVLPFCLFTFLLFMASGCIEEYEADIPADESEQLVVEGTICSSAMNTFVVSHTMPLKRSQEDAQDDSEWDQSSFSDAIVSVRGSDGSEYKTQGSYGHYSCWIGQLNPDVKYYLHIEADGEVFESEPQKPLPTEKIIDVTGVQNTPESSINVLITPEEPFESNKVNYYSWTYDETWEVHPDYTTTIYYDTELKRKVDNVTSVFPECGWIDATGTTIMVGASTHYGHQHIQGLKLYAIDRSNERMYYRYSGLIHQRAITKGEYEYELARRQAETEMGGLYTPLPSALPTNIHCLTSSKHVIGYVGCSLNTSEYRFFLDPNDFSIGYPRYVDSRWWVENPNENDCLYMAVNGWHLCVWDEEIGGPLHTAWAQLYQLDVRYKYGYTNIYIEKPDFW